MSSKTGEGFDELINKIAELLPEPDRSVEVVIPYNRGDLVSRLHLNSRILELEYRDQGTYVRAMVKPDIAAELEQFSVR